MTVTEGQTTPMSGGSSAGDKKNQEWAEREVYWRRRLGRLRLGVEPLEEQLARYFRVTWALTVVPAIIALVIISIFIAFEAPKIGLLIAGILFLPPIAVAWMDYAKIRARADAYERERREFFGLKDRDATGWPQV
jgi:hypothetical protein